MKMHFNAVEGRVLHGLIEDALDDIVVRLDNSGFIIHASANANELGIDLNALLLMPHIADLAEPEYAGDVIRHVARVLDGETDDRDNSAWIEFPLLACEDELDDPYSPPVRARRWYALSLRAIDHDDGTPQGALGLLRSVQHKHPMGGEQGSHAAPDPHTGLASRHTFCASLARGLDHCEQQSMAIFAVDRMRAIFMQYGQTTSDEIRWGFAKFLETMTRPDQELAQIDDQRFGVILPDMSLRAAREWATDVLETFAGLTTPSSSRSPELTASAGLARVEISVDWTMRQAELGLVMARAGGGMQAAVCQPSSGLVSSAMVERAMEAAVQRAERRHA